MRWMQIHCRQPASYALGSQTPSFSSSGSECLLIDLELVEVLKLMITGKINPRNEAIVPLTMHGPTGKSMPIDFVLDTGSTDALSLPTESILPLDLPSRGTEDFVLANGQVEALPVFSGAVMWDGRLRPTRIVGTGGGPLLGVELLHGHRVLLDVLPEGEVLIQAIDASTRSPHEDMPPATSDRS
jgi:predicted aspartyl protease